MILLPKLSNLCDQRCFSPGRHEDISKAGRYTVSAHRLEKLASGKVDIAPSLDSAKLTFQFQCRVWYKDMVRYFIFERFLVNGAAQ